MNRKFFLLLAAVPCFCGAKAQDLPSRLTLKAYGGYGLLTPGADFFTNIAIIDNDHARYTNERYGYGRGVHTGAGADYKLANLFSIGLDADYLSGSKTSPYNPTDDNNSAGTLKMSHSVLSLVPQVTISIRAEKKLEVYNSMGVMLSMAVRVQQSGNYTISGGATPVSDRFVEKFRYGLRAGFRDNLGFKVKVAERLRFFAELSYYDIAVKPSQSTQVDNSNTGVTTKIFNYKDSGPYNQGINTSPNTSVYVEAAITQHLQAAGLNAGFLISLK